MVRHCCSTAVRFERARRRGNRPAAPRSLPLTKWFVRQSGNERRLAWFAFHGRERILLVFSVGRRGQPSDTCIDGDGEPTAHHACFSRGTSTPASADLQGDCVPADGASTRGQAHGPPRPAGAVEGKATQSARAGPGLNQLSIRMRAGPASVLQQPSPWPRGR